MISHILLVVAFKGQCSKGHFSKGHCSKGGGGVFISLDRGEATRLDRIFSEDEKVFLLGGGIEAINANFGMKGGGTGRGNFFFFLVGVALKTNLGENMGSKLLG